MHKRLTPVLLILGLLFAGCSKAPVRAVPQAAAAPEVKAIRLATQEGVEPWLDPVITAFQEQHPEYRIEKVPYHDYQAFQDILDKGAADVVPSSGSLEALAKRGLLTDLAPFIAKSRFDTAPHGPLVMAAMTISGKVVALPAYGMPMVFIYNKRLAQQAGVTIPADRWTWEELRDTAARLTHGTGDDKVWGLEVGGVVSEDVVLMQGLGLVPAGAFPDVDAARKAFSFWQGMVMDDHSMRPLPVLNSEKRPSVSMCAQGKAAICVQTLEYLTQGPNGADFQLAPLPAVTGRNPILFEMLRSYGIHARAADPDAAWAFVSFLTGPEGAALIARQGLFPAYASEVTRKAWAEATPPPPAGTDALFNATWYVEDHFYEMSGPSGVFWEQSNGILSGTVTVDKAVAAFAAALSTPGRH